ncbi:related to endoglucanase-Polyporus arcularius [Serendipita indica DSM 11827]|uniref:cellulase n=1 Tax=Serendipita indica (strain DSM 11827) TaxID=1109443 RepID=G4TZ66_SERID|nr:related to endoglucanase-Polyporus arcularius [Serendipita indica DSM 11827]
MKQTLALVSLAVTFVSQANAIAQWQQCADVLAVPTVAYSSSIGWTGSGTCDVGLQCVYLNDWYSQCLVATSTSSATRSTSTSSSVSTRSTSTSTSTRSISTSTSTSTRTTSTSAITSTRTSTRTSSTSTASGTACPSSTPPAGQKFKYIGVNMAGYDFGCGADGTCNPTGAFPPLAKYYGPDGIGQMTHFFQDDKFNTFRVPVGWQYLTNGVLGDLDATNFAKYDEFIQACLGLGAYCIVDVHNYARWNGKIIGQGGPTNEQFAYLWGQIAAKYASNDHIIFGIMNEPHDVPDINAWAASVQAAVTAIRKAGAMKQICLLPGNNWTSAETFISNGSAEALAKVTNPDGSTTGLVFDVHKYLDYDNSGTNTECVRNNIDNAFGPLAQWLRCRGRQAFNSETGGGNTASCVNYFCQQVAFEQANADVFIGITGWAAGSFAVDP